jgi:predicted DsbA family dithiol-disulfide isomerase
VVTENMLAAGERRQRGRRAEEVATASRMGITGVPCFLLEGKYAVMGAQDAATLATAIKDIATKAAA